MLMVMLIIIVIIISSWPQVGRKFSETQERKREQTRTAVVDESRNSATN